MLRTVKAFDFSIYDFQINFEVGAFVTSGKTHDTEWYKGNLCPAFEILSGSCLFSLRCSDIEGKTICT